MNYPKRISRLGLAALAGTAIVFDIIQVLLDLAFGAGVILNRILDVFLYALFWLLFKVKGINIVGGKNLTKKFSTSLGSFAIELIPVADILPAWTFMVTTNTVISWQEDKETHKQMLAQQAAEAKALAAREAGEAQTIAQTQEDEETLETAEVISIEEARRARQVRLERENPVYGNIKVGNEALRPLRKVA